MLDIKLLRNELDHVVGELQKRGFEFPKAQFQALEETRKESQSQSEQLQAKKKQLSQKIGQAKAQGAQCDHLVEEVNLISEQQRAITQTYEQTRAELDYLLACIPNIPDETTPIGESEDDNVEIRRVGEPKQFDYPIKDHADLENIGIDFDNASKISGARFLILHGQLAKLHRALAQFMLDTHTQNHGYQETYTPYLVNERSLYGSGQLPKFKDDLFKTQLGKRDFYLIPTAEVTLTNLVAGEIINENELPIKVTAHTPCFRSEAGSAGRDVRGMIRQHQFDKVELVQICKPSESEQALERLTQHAETILQLLELPYRVMQLCSGDIGFSAKKTYDLEVWLPGQQKYREISSCSNCGDFQARRMQARFREQGEKNTQFVHTLNGSGLAVGRTLVAILENYQEADGSIKIPDALMPYMGGIKEIKAQLK